MNELNTKQSCPIVPNPYRGTAGQAKESGTDSGTSDGTENLKSLAGKVLNRKKVGQHVGQTAGQSNKSCPKPSNPVGQTVSAVPDKHNDKSEREDPFDHQIKLEIQDLNKKNISMMDYPAATRQKALELELKMTQAANKNDRINFITLLRQWRNCFN